MLVRQTRSWSTPLRPSPPCHKWLPNPRNSAWVSVLQSAILLEKRALHPFIRPLDVLLLKRFR